MRKLYYIQMVNGFGDKSIKIFTNKQDAKKYCKSNFYDFKNVKSEESWSDVFLINGKVNGHYNSFDLKIK